MVVPIIRGFISTAVILCVGAAYSPAISRSAWSNDLETFHKGVDRHPDTTDERNSARYRILAQGSFSDFLKHMQQDIQRILDPQSSSESSPQRPESPARQAITDTTSERSTWDQAAVREVQQRLASLGYDPGPIDGVLGGRTRDAIRSYQHRRGMQVDGQITEPLLAKLRTETVALSGAQKPVVLTIDGISLFATLNLGPAGDRVTSYLQDGFNSHTWPFVERWESVPWSGRVQDTNDTVADVKNYVRLISNLASAENRPFVVVAHSWGSVLAYRSILELKAEGVLKDRSVSLFITMGSPINAHSSEARDVSKKHDQFKQRGGGAAVASVVAEWVNYWTEGDLVSGPLHDPGVMDVRLGGQESKVSEAHRAYYTKDAFVALIGQRILSAIRSRNAGAPPQIATSRGSTVQAPANSPSPASQARRYRDNGWIGLWLLARPMGNVAGGINYKVDGTVISVQPGSPAAKAGIRSGDQILDINGRFFMPYTIRTERASKSDRTALTFDPAAIGKSIRLTVQRKGAGKFTAVTEIVTSPIAVQPSQAQGKGGVALRARCGPCHTTRKGGNHKVGPNLYGIVGARAGSKPGYRYSKALRNSSFVWTEENLYRFLRNPRKSLPGNKMAFHPLSHAKALQAIDALKTLRD